MAFGRHSHCGMRIPAGFWVLGKEILRHILRRPVVGICAAARTRDGEWVSYSCHRHDSAAVFEGRYRPTGPADHARPPTSGRRE